jgi:hypothetical protein
MCQRKSFKAMTSDSINIIKVSSDKVSMIHEYQIVD